MNVGTLVSAQRGVRSCRRRDGEREMEEVAPTLVCLHRGQMLSSSIESPGGTGGVLGWHTPKQRALTSAWCFNVYKKYLPVCLIIPESMYLEETTRFLLFKVS